MGGLPPIPWSKIKEYAVFFDFDDEETEDLFFFVREMEAEEREVAREKQEKPKSKAGMITF